MTFQLEGHRIPLRDFDELETIDKKAADKGFVQAKKEVLDPFMLEKGFVKWKSGDYARLNGLGHLEYLGLQKEAYGSKTFTVNVAIMPLYVETDYMVLTLGKRLGFFIGKTDIWWDYANYVIGQKSFSNVRDAIEVFALDWWQKYRDPIIYRKKLEKNQGKEPLKEWLEAFDKGFNNEVLYKNGDKLKLPKKLFKGI